MPNSLTSFIKNFIRACSITLDSGKMQYKTFHSPQFNLHRINLINHLFKVAQTFLKEKEVHQTKAEKKKKVMKKNLLNQESNKILQT